MAASSISTIFLALVASFFSVFFLFWFVLLIFSVEFFSLLVLFLLFICFIPSFSPSLGATVYLEFSFAWRLVLALASGIYFTGFQAFSASLRTTCSSSKMFAKSAAILICSALSFASFTAWLGPLPDDFPRFMLNFYISFCYITIAATSYIDAVTNLNECFWWLSTSIALLTQVYSW